MAKEKETEYETKGVEPVRIVGWDRRYSEDFVRLNKEWIERYFRLEPCDLKVLSDPEGKIIKPGGEIFFALLGDKVVGCCALIHHAGNPERHELAKMAVSPVAQGRGIGTRLGEALVAYARAQGVRRLFLEANTRLEPSVKLYRRLGFRDVVDGHAAFDRCNLYMELDL